MSDNTPPDGWRLQKTDSGRYFCERAAGSDAHGGETTFAHATAEAAIQDARHPWRLWRRKKERAGKVLHGDFKPGNISMEAVAPIAETLVGAKVLCMEVAEGMVSPGDVDFGLAVCLPPRGVSDADEAEVRAALAVYGLDYDEVGNAGVEFVADLLARTAPPKIPNAPGLWLRYDVDKMEEIECIVWKLPNGELVWAWGAEKPKSRVCFPLHVAGREQWKGPASPSGSADPGCPMCEGQPPVIVDGVTQYCEGCEPDGDDGTSSRGTDGEASA